MKRNFGDYLIALAVIACSLVLVGALTVALSGYRFGKPGRTFEVDFINVAGIKLHSEVRYAGARIGKVIALRHLTPAEREPAPRHAVRVTVGLEESAPPLPADVTVAIASDTLLSEKFVALSGGMPGGEVLKDGGLLAAEETFGLDDILSLTAPTLKTANALLTSLNQELVALMPRLNELIGSLDGLLDSTHPVIAQAKSTLSEAEKLILDNKDGIHNRLDELGVTLDKLTTMLVNVDEFVGSTDRATRVRLKEMGVVLQNLKVVTTHAKAITQTLGERPSRLIWGAKRKNLPTEEEILRSDRPLPATRP